MSGKEPKSVSAPRMGRIAGLALAAGAGAGALGIYVMQTVSGNQALASACPASAVVAKAIDDTARGEVAAVTPIDEPFDARTIVFRDLDGKRSSLADFTGKTLLVNLWATWCAPCRAEMPALDALEKRHGDKDFAVVPISIDLGDDAKPKSFFADVGLTSLPLYRDETMGVFNDLKARGLALGLPTSLLVDAKGCARAVLSGPAQWDSADAAKLIEAVKGGAGPT